MPASTLDPVNTALRTSLSKNIPDNSLEAQLAGSTKKALLSNIEFEPAESFHSSVLEKLKSKYIVLKGPEPKQVSQPEPEMGADESLKLAKYELFPLDAVQLGWSNYDWSVGSGMINMGNTCYLNSTLQALFHVPALVNWLMSDKEHSECQESGGICIICAMKKTLQESQQRSANSIRPLLIYNKLRMFCRNFIAGRQEDAHEFLRILVESMEKAYLSRFKNHSELDSRIKETTPLNQILGGYLRSAVHCLECGHVSTTFQHFQDLLLDIRKAQTLDEALEGYFSREKLDDESYHCEACRKKVGATKQFSVERTPMVLCIQLKRFSVTNTKISKHISFRQRLDLTKYARHRPNVPLIYRLVALVTHMGPTVNCGHYTAVAQAPGGNYYQFDDSTVRPISHQAVFNTNAYIMLYELESAPFSQKSSNSLNKIKIQNLKTEVEQSSSSSTTSKNVSKPTTNGIGFTSSKPYGPELPPKKAEKNGESSSNGNGKYSDSPASSDSEPDKDLIKKASEKPSTPTKPHNDVVKKSPTPKSPSKISFSNSVANKTSESPKHIKDNAKETATQLVAKLVPYDTNDSSNSDDSNSTNIPLKEVAENSSGEWKVTSTNNESEEPKSWTKSNSQPADNTVKELFKMSHSGYSAPVNTWNGTRSELDKEVNNERREERKRALQDNADEGRVKHVKTSNYNNNKSNPGYNPVQEYHNAKNWGQNNRHYNNKPFFSGRHRHKNNFHHKNNYHNNKSYRYRQL